MSKPRASIVMASYNRAHLLRETYKTLVPQVEFPFEVVLVDDGSQDDTKDVPREFPQVTTQYFYLNRPYYCGPSRALNVGIRNAEADVLILQNPEVMHIAKDNIRRLTEAVENDHDEIVFGKVGSGPGDTYSQAWRCYCGTANPRPFFFLGAIWKQHLLDIRGFDEDWVYTWYEDMDLADRLVDNHPDRHEGNRKGLSLRYRFDDTIYAEHQAHPRNEQEQYKINQSTALYREKTALWNEGKINHIRNLDREWGQLDEMPDQ